MIAHTDMAGHETRFAYDSAGRLTERAGVGTDATQRYAYLNTGLALSVSTGTAKKTRAQIVCTPWHIKDAYDGLVEIEDSDWVNEILLETKDRRERSGEAWELHHYLLYLDGSGCIEVVAASWKVLDEERGSWT